MDSGDGGGLHEVDGGIGCKALRSGERRCGKETKRALVRLGLVCPCLRTRLSPRRGEWPSVGVSVAVCCVVLAVAVAVAVTCSLQPPL